MQSIKCVTVGDGSVGKTCMLESLVRGNTPLEYVPTIFDNYAYTLEADDGRMINLELWDTAGQEDYDRLRPLSYTNANVILLCFSVVNPGSFKNIELKWVLEVKHFCPKAKIILIGTKSDLRCDQGTINCLKQKSEKPITFSEGASLAKQIGAFRYLECSAFTRIGLLEVFEAAVKSLTETPVRKKKRCSIL